MVLALCLLMLLPARAVASETSAEPTGASSAGTATTGDSGGGSTSNPPKPAPQHYNPPTGLKTNNPLGSRARKTEINRHVLRLINSVPGRQKIRVASWNVRSDAFVDALIRAHRRGVSVRVALDRVNAKPDNVNVGVDRLQNALGRYGNKWRKWQYKSFVRRCRSACRGPRGIAHTKFFTFSRVGGGARNVVVNGSSNATDLAATNQWNDVYTTKNRYGIYAEFNRVFDQMMRDRNVAQGYVSTRRGAITTYFFPYRGSGASGDPVMRWLNDTSCSGATGGAGTRGKTRIRIAMTSWHGQRGIRLAYRVKQMYNRGCDVRIIYAVMGNEILRIMRRGGRGAVPMRQIVQDPNGDGVYDRYLHMKVLTISGRYRGNGSARVTFNGSANWSPAALPSDEAGMRIYGAGLLGAYNRWIEYLFANPPYRRSGRATSSNTDIAGRTTAGSTATAPEERPPWEVEKLAEERGVDPYSQIEVD